jgi:glucan biosynthesis protein C
VSFTAEPIGGAWPYMDENTSVFFDIVVFFIHVFRMPLFFMMAGFFSACFLARVFA